MTPLFLIAQIFCNLSPSSAELDLDSEDTALVNVSHITPHSLVNVFLHIRVCGGANSSGLRLSSTPYTCMYIHVYVCTYMCMYVHTCVAVTGRKRTLV